ncbi:tyrosine-type recombinase/integrase [Flavobacterium fluviatile]|uniref:tyrosine-type recombinase/integrase n=1 Tax=Flavobacterium fluviatile TaxID=1862387 RepID=UPI0013D0047D|nr:tyrosine-type recombinase/integrase [Flavobacterium fluviatile]
MRKLEFTFSNEPTNEPVTIRINVGMRNYSDVKLFIPKVDGKPSVLPNKRWYVYYYFRNPETGLMEKFKDYCKINTYKTVNERKEIGKVWVDAYTLLLSQGLNPFADNPISEKILAEPLKKSVKPKAAETESFENIKYTVRTALNYAYDNKLGTWKESTASDYITRLNVFLQWTKANKLDKIDIAELKDVHVIAFMNWLTMPKPKGRGVGGTSQDNYKRCLSGLFEKLVKDKIIDHNFLADVDTKKNDPIKNTPFTGYQVKEIREYLLQHDKQLYHFIQFVIFTFLRNREIIRLTAGDINLKEKYLKIETKTQARQTKRLVGPVLTYLNEINVSSLPKKAHLFTNTGAFEIWDASEKTKVDHFGNRFKKVKNHFGYGDEYGIYSFRHTAALDLFFSHIKKGLTEREAILKLMPATGHASEDALRNYLRDIGGMLPKDYGADYTLEF